MCLCSPSDGNTAVDWVRSTFSDCLYTPTDMFSFIVGLLSIVLWLGAQAPQLYKNYQNKTAVSLSIVFLANWMTGDIMNLAGCILTQQLPTQLYTAIYFVCIDTATILQYTYYGKIYKRKQASAPSSASSTASSNAPSRVLAVALPFVALLCLVNVSIFASSEEGMDQFSPSSRTLLGSDDECNANTAAQWQNVVGTVIAWGSGCIYVSSRIPQIYRNFKRGTTDGLSPLMFMAAIMGNVTYGVSILTRLPLTWDYMQGKLPFILGSLGTCAFDTTILLQFLYYRNHRHAYRGIPIEESINSHESTTQA